ncbi:MAG: hypothetical protein ABIN67_02925 [Ferruginibacter sp.]
MTLKSLFSIILKVIGIFFIKNVVEIIPQIISIFFYLNSETYGEAIWMLISSGVTLGAYLIIINYLLFRTETVISKLNLESELENETITFKLHRSAILSISIIIIGGLLLAEEIPNFCKEMILYFQVNRINYRQTDVTLSKSVLAGAKILIGLLLIGNQREITNFIELKREKKIA